MKRALLLSFLSLIWIGFSKAQSAYRLTPFTGVDYVRVVVDKTFKTSAGSTFKLLIRSPKDGKILWQGPVNATAAVNEGNNHLAFTVRNLKPVLWTPNKPFLYDISLLQYNGKTLNAELKERAGFRSFERRKGNLYLNGRPIFLRGIAINPPGRGIPDELEKSRAFALDYVKYMKSINVNIIRIPDEEAWFDVCDELGMMVFGGNYSGKVAAGEKVKDQVKVGDETDGGFPKDHDKGVAWYENEKLGAIAHHPSLMVYAMTNETPFKGSRADAWEKFLDYAFHKLKKWDETRVYIANAGYGYGKTGDILDIHRYWGWYYSSPFTFLHIRDNAKIVPFPKKEDMPITFTECVGNYTGPDGRYNLTPQHKNPSSQLAWTGHERQDLQAQLADEHQSFTLRQATESFRQLRAVNPDLSGVFPFTILFYNWNTIEKFADMKPKPVTDQVKISYQPVLLSWECWTPNVYAGSVISPIAHISNDDNDFKDLKNTRLVYLIRDKTHTIVFSDSINMADIPYYANVKKKLSIKLPKDLSSGKYELIGRVMANGKQVSYNYYKLFIADDNFTRSIVPADNNVLLYDKEGKTKKSLAALGLKFNSITSFARLPEKGVLIIGENAADQELASGAGSIRNFMSAGGRVVALRQDSLHMIQLNQLAINPLQNRNVDIDDPVYPVSSKSPRNGYYVNAERPDHPLFAGITRENMRIWSDYTNWDETKAGMPAIQPVTDGFVLEHKADVSNTTILANYSSGLQGIAIAEQFLGKGSLLLCGLDISNRTSIDPVAARMMLNMVSYASAAGHEQYQLISSPIVWGEYETEKGIVVDAYSGFLVNATPRVPPGYLGKGIVVTKEGYQLAGGVRSGFNTRPGIQYVANGRRPFGPYAQSFGGQPLPDKDSTEGIGSFWCRIPEGQNMASSMVWNPGKEPVQLKIKVNDLAEISKTIPAGAKIAIETPVNAAVVHLTYSGDRRVVILETAFSKKN
ncbi:glycoside hydrolase family 2 TIM barrel-domain containing protein [Pedobacter heparinus]|uniref:glycoside hydrolase family 2 TIM barrel-domain containing protein n=1 Tax=Pedobacter heparinus TaxID=984 RepID=UPI002931806D|nr:glycoside hydrolase family 2 TIM barrel-domain containing protein [Pedobacter heparinus]